MNYGFIPDKIEKNHFTFGSGQLGAELLVPSGHWLPYLPPTPELQYNSFFDSSNCTAYGTLNCIETLLRRKFLNTPDWKPDYNDFSERVLGIMAHTRPPGNSPHTVAEALRKGGAVGQEYLIFDDSIQSIDQYYSPDPLTKDLVDKGQEFLVDLSVGHDWVTDCSPAGLKFALQFSPLGVALYAWQLGPNGYYVRPPGAPDVHWVSLVDFKEGEYWVIYDSYLADGEPLKKLDWDFGFSQVKRYSIGKALTLPQKKSLIALLKSFVSWIDWSKIFGWKK